MLTANAMAFGISFGATELLKHTIDEGRPDQSDLHSFPSGHTSFAFASATILNREYGYISPWIAVGGYMTAAGTEFLRVNHNKHWMNDLYMGAGIGVMSTNLAYFLTDKIFGEKGINKPELRKRDVLRLMKFNEKATGFSFIMGTEIGDRSIRFEDARVKTGAAVSAGADMTWFVTPKVAVELMTRAVDAQAKVYDTKNVFSGGHLNLYHFDLGGKLSSLSHWDNAFPHVPLQVFVWWMVTPSPMARNLIPFLMRPSLKWDLASPMSVWIPITMHGVSLVTITTHFPLT